MTSTYILTTIAALVAAIASTAAVARPDQALPGANAAHISKNLRANPVLREVPNRSLPTQAGYGWKYFTDPRAAHAVMISSSGEYFLSLGRGPNQITWLEGHGPAPVPAQN